VSEVKSINGNYAAMLARVVIVIVRNCLFTPYKTNVRQFVVGVATHRPDVQGIESFQSLPTRPFRPLLNQILVKWGPGPFLDDKLAEEWP
jgi:hypothetical protein